MTAFIKNVFFIFLMFFCVYQYGKSEGRHEARAHILP